MRFDKVIVGGGSAGAVLANRLSARSSDSVALFEAGPDTPPDAVPKIIADSYPGLSYFDPNYHWRDLRVYTRSPRLNDGHARLSKLEQAKVMGGGSSINGQFAVRGLPADYDGWEAMGLPGWGWDGLLPYFKKLERDLDFDGVLHGKDGRIPIRRLFPKDWAGFTHAVLDAAQASGEPYREDYNASFDDGSFPLPLSNENDRRVSTAVGYLDAQTRKRPNLSIFAESFVERVRFEGTRVTGIDVVRNGERLSVEAGEVIVSSGALHSPAVLMRSGVGPPGHLKHHGIAVVADLRGVGENLTDHPHIAFGTHLRPAARIQGDMRRHIYLGIRYSSGVEGCTPGDMLIMPVNRSGWHPLGRGLGALNVCVNTSYSTGTVRLSSADPAVEPEVDLNLASDGRDLTRLVRGFKRLYAIMESPAVKAITTTYFLAGYSDAVRALSVRSLPNWLRTAAAAALFDYAPFARDHLIKRRFGTPERLRAMAQDDDAIADWVKSTVWSGWHVSGTCRMGADGDSMAVLDAHCRVRGVQGLRVVDASVMPAVCSANTNITTIAIAEKAADLIFTAERDIMKENKARTILLAGGEVTTGWLAIPSSISAELMAKQGFDALTIDMQHGAIDYVDMVPMLQAISTTDTTPMVRAPWNDRSILGRILDAGAYGVICPMINSGEEADAFVKACKYHPKGLRSVGPLRASLYAGSDYVKNANDTILTMAMVESRQAIDNLDDILSVPGLDGIYVGPSDLSVSMGESAGFDPRFPAVYEAIQYVAARCKERKLIAGIHVGSVAYGQEMREAGYRFMAYLSDFRMMQWAASNALAAFRTGKPVPNAP